MKKIIILLVLVVFTLSCKKEREQQKAQGKFDTDSLTAVIDSFYKQSEFNGLAVSLVNEKGTLYEKGFGYADIENKIPYTDQTIQNIASISKVLVGVALLQAQEFGKLKLDDPINDYLPFKVIHPVYPKKVITIRHLATHTSGIVDNAFYLSKNYILKEGESHTNEGLVFDESQVFNPSDSLISMEDFLKNVLVKGGKWNTQETFSTHKPGAMYEYSNIGTTLAALVLEQATGERFDAFTQKHILTPLKMKASGWNFESVTLENYSNLYADPKTKLPFYRMITYPDGNFITSVHDLSLFLSELIQGYKGGGILLTQTSYQEFFRPQLQAENFMEREENNPYDESYNVGIFIGFGFSGYIGHTGGDPGVASLLFFDPEQLTGRIMIVNTSFSGQKASRDFYSIWDALKKQ